MITQPIQHGVQVGDYQGQLAAHDFPGKVANIRERLLKAPPESHTLMEETDAGAEERLEVLLDQVLVATATALATAVPTDKPGLLADSLADLETNVAYMADPSVFPSYVQNVVAATSNLGAVLWTWPWSATSEDWREAVREAATTYRRSAGQQFASLNAELAQLAHQIADVRDEVVEVSQANQQRDVQLDTDQAAFQERQRALIATLETNIEGMQAQVASTIGRQDASILAYQSQFSESQERRNNEFLSLSQDAEHQFSVIRDEQEANAIASINALQAEVDTAKELVSVFAGAGTAHAFGKEASQQGDAANTWRWVGIALALLGAAVGLVLFFAVGNDKSSTEQIVSKLTITLVIAGTAGYAVAQSSAHRKREVVNRRAELLMVSFEPFARDLPELDRDKARVALLQTLMTESAVTPKGAEDSSDLSATSQLNLMKQLFDLLMKR